MGYLLKTAGATIARHETLLAKLKGVLAKARNKVTDFLLDHTKETEAVAGGAGAIGLPKLVSTVAHNDFINSKLPEIAEEANTEKNIKAFLETAKKAKQEGIDLVVGPGVGGPAYVGPYNTIIYDTQSVAPHAGVLAHELGHAKVHKKLKEVLGDDAGDVVSTYGSGLLGNFASPITTLAALVPAVRGKTKASLITGGIGSALMLPRLADEGVASWWGKNWLDENDLAGGDKAWSGFGTYVAAGAAPMLPAAGSAGAKKLIKLLTKLK
jgi:hypothetical protein